MQNMNTGIPDFYTQRDCVFYNAAGAWGCEFLCTGKPTYLRTDLNKIPDLFDIFVWLNYIKVEEGCILNSDHLPILFTICDQLIYNRQDPATEQIGNTSTFCLKIIITSVFH